MAKAKELKFHKSGGYDIEIVDIEEVEDILRVKTRTPYGEDNLGISNKKKYLDTDGKPKWKKEVKRLLDKKYGKHLGDGETSAKPKKVFKEHLGVYNISEM